MLFNAEEWAVIARACEGLVHITTKSIRTALKKSGIKCRHTGEQLSNFVGRYNTTHRFAPVADQHRTPVELLRSHVEQWVGKQGVMAASRQAQLHILNDVREPIIESGRIYIPFASKGMLASIRGARGQYLKMVVDAKQKVLTNRWSILTVGFIVRRQTLSTTSSHGPGGKRAQVKAHTSTMQPLLQALIDTESEDNLAAIFEDAGKVCQSIAGIDLPRWLIQVPKDYAKGIESARRRVFPHIRAVEDYFHMRLNVTNALLEKLGKHKVVTESQAEFPPAEACPAAPGEAAPAMAAPVAATEAAPPAAKAKAKKAGKKIGERYYGPITEWIVLTRFLPTLQLFDAIWRVCFRTLEVTWKEANALQYLRDTYFTEVKVESLQSVFKHIHKICWGCKTMLIAGHWYGILGTAPGTGTGSQTIEARQSDWQELLRTRCKAKVFSIWPTMQEIYESWEDTFAWGAKVAFTNMPRHFNETLLNGAGLKKAGRSTAVEFWHNRGKQNYREIHQERDPYSWASMHTRIST